MKKIIIIGLLICCNLQCDDSDGPIWVDAIQGNQKVTAPTEDQCKQKCNEVCAKTKEIIKITKDLKCVPINAGELGTYYKCQCFFDYISITNKTDFDIIFDKNILKKDEEIKIKGGLSNPFVIKTKEPQTSSGMEIMSNTSWMENVFTKNKEKYEVTVWCGNSGKGGKDYCILHIE